jgi:hypothetical protein
LFALGSALSDADHTPRYSILHAGAPSGQISGPRKRSAERNAEERFFLGLIGSAEQDSTKSTAVEIVTE